MADEVRAKLVYDVTSARTQIRSLDSDLGRLERPLSLVVQVDDSQVGAATAEINSLSAALASLSATVDVDDSQLTAAADEAEALDRSLNDIDVAVAVDDSQVTAAVDEAGALQRQIDDIGGTIDIDDSQVTSAISEVGALQTEVDSISGTVNIDVSTTGTEGAPGAGGGLGGLFQGLGGLTNLLKGGVAPAAGQASGAMAGLGSAAGGAAAGIGSVAAVAGPAAIAVGVLVAAVLSLKAAIEAVIAIGTTIVDLAGPAGDLAESINAAGLIFGDQTDNILAFGDSAAEAFGLAESAFLELANSVGASLAGLGVELESIDELTAATIKLATDLGSAFNISTEQGVQAIQAGLRGEFEQLESIRIFIKQADINAELARRGLEGLTGEAEKSAKALITLQLVQQQAARTADDFGNTLGKSLPNQLKVARANFEDLRTAFSEPFVDPALDIVKSLNEDLIPALEDAFLVVEPVVKELAEIGGGLVVDAINGTVTLIQYLEASFENLLRTVATVTDASPFTAGLFPSVDEVDRFFDVLTIKRQDAAKKRLDASKNEVGDLRALLEAQLEGIELSPEQQAAFDKLFGAITSGADDGARAVAGLALETERLHDAMSEAKISVDDLADALKEAFDKPTSLDAAVALADFEKAKADIFKDIAETRKLPFGEQNQAQLQVLKQISEDFEAFVLSPGFDPSTLDAQRNALIEQARAASVSHANLALFVEDLNAVKNVGDIKLQVAIRQDIAALGQLEDVDAIIRRLVANPEVKIALDTFGFDPALDKSGKLQEALDILNGTRSHPTLDDESLQAAVDVIDLAEERFQNLDEAQARPTIGVNDEATLRLQSVAALVRDIAQQRAEVVVNVIGNASAVLFSIQSAADAATQAILRLRAEAVVNATLEAVRRAVGFEMGGIVSVEQDIHVAEGNKRELVLPLEQPWDRQMSLLDQAGVLQKLEAEFTAAEQARASALNRAMTWPANPAEGSRVSLADLEAIAVRMEEAARMAARESRPINAAITVPALSDEHETARVLRRKLARL